LRIFNTGKLNKYLILALFNDHRLRNTKLVNSVSNGFKSLSDCIVFEACEFFIAKNKIDKECVALCLCCSCFYIGKFFTYKVVKLFFLLRLNSH